MIKEKISNFEVSISFNGLGIGSSLNPFSALARPYRKIINTGKPCGKITHIFAVDEKKKSYIIGSLEYTLGKRVIFYPGLTDRKLNWYTKMGQLHHNERKTGDLMDHFTLEKNLTKWHVSYYDFSGNKTKKTPTYFTLHFDELLFWFGLGITDYSVLEIAPKIHTFLFNCPASDGKRRSEAIKNSRVKADMKAITTIEPRSEQKKKFIYYDFFIAPENYRHDDIWPCCAPTSKPALVENYSGLHKKKLSTDMMSIYKILIKK